MICTIKLKLHGGKEQLIVNHHGTFSKPYIPLLDVDSKVPDKSVHTIQPII